jgi:predicted  nucleic acid-binding Zn-ribbon protein
MSQIDLLYRLQQIEDEVRNDEKRLTVVIRLQSESTELITARRRVAAIGETLHGRRAKQKDLSLELDSLITKAQRSETRLYSGTIKNPKELEDLQHEIDSLTRRRSNLEDELLEAMIAVEETEEEEKDASETLNNIETKWSQTAESSKEEQALLVKRLGELAAQKRELIGLIRPESMGAYEATARRTGPTVVVALSNKRCRGCLVSVPDNLVKAADEGKMIHCDNCGRILCPV